MVVYSPPERKVVPIFMVFLQMAGSPKYVVGSRWGAASLANARPPGLGCALFLIFPVRGGFMSDDSKRRPGRKPYNGVIVRADVSEPGDEAVGQWSHAQLVRMDNRFRQPIQRAFHRDRRPASGSAVASTGLENIANRIDPPRAPVPQARRHQEQKVATRAAKKLQSK